MSSHRLFLSYSRHNEGAAQALAAELRQLGQNVWIDAQLSGGQQWWDTILAQIRECDCFVFMISDASLESKACRAELEYAHRLGRFILPVSADDRIHDPLLPHFLAETQRIDVSDPSTATHALARALLSLPMTPPLPNPLPPPPPVPISYLDELAQLVGGRELDKTQQLMLLAELKQRLGDEREREAVVALLEQFQRRADLYAAVAVEISQLLQGANLRTPTPPPPDPATVPPPPPVQAAPPAMPRPPAPRRRAGLIAAGAAVGVLVLSAVGIAVAMGGPDPTPTPPTTAASSAEGPTTDESQAEGDTGDPVADSGARCAAGESDFCDLLADWCVDGDTTACQVLYDSTPYDTIGDALARCGLGAMSSCDDLYWSTDTSTQWELFGSTCGGRYERADGRCMELYG